MILECDESVQTYRAAIAVSPQQSQAELLVSSIFIHSVLAVPMFCQKVRAWPVFHTPRQFRRVITCDGLYIIV